MKKKKPRLLEGFAPRDDCFLDKQKWWQEHDDEHLAVSLDDAYEIVLCPHCDAECFVEDAVRSTLLCWTCQFEGTLEEYKRP